MATEKEVISIEVAGGDKIDKATNSVAQLKKELKEAKNAALNGDGSAAKRVAELTDRMEDLKDETKSLQGSGVEKLKNSFGLLTDGFKNFDGDKISTAFKGIGSAMKAIPLILIIEGIRFLIENFDELSKGSGILATVLRGVGDAINTVKNFVTDLVGATDDSTRALEKQGEAIKTNSDKLTTALTEQTAAFDRQIAVAKVSGQSTVELEKKKQQAIIETNFLIAKQIEAFVRAGGELDDEKKKQLSASLEFIKNAKVQEFVITETDKNARLAAKRTEKEQFQQLEGEFDARLKEQKLTEKELELQQLQGLNETYKQLEFENLVAFNEKEKELKRQQLQEGLALTGQSLQAAQGLSDAFFALKQQGAKGDAKKELELKKKQFQVNKAFAISNAIMSGIMGVQSQLQAGPIVGPILAGLVGITAALNVAKIASAKFEGGSIDTSGGGSGGAPTLPQANTNVPTINPALNPQNQNTTTFTGNVNNNVQQPIKVYLPEVDIKNAINSADKIRTQATF